jgi:hypothetical protein
MSRTRSYEKALSPYPDDLVIVTKVSDRRGGGSSHSGSASDAIAWVQFFRSI